MIGEIITELERAVQGETEELAPLSDGDHQGTAPQTHQVAASPAAVNISERSVVSASSSVSSLDEQQLDDYLQQFIHEEDEHEHEQDDDNFENSMEFDLDNDQDQAGPSLTSDYTGDIDRKIERYLQSPKKSIKRSVTKDAMVKRGSVQAVTSLFSAPLQDNTFQVTPKKPKKPWTPNASKPSPRLSSSSIMEKVNIFSQSLPAISFFDDDDEDAPPTATSPHKKRALTAKQDTARTARKALAGRHRLMRQAATTIQARARGYLVRKFDLKAMNKVMNYVKEYQALGLGLNHDDDEMPHKLEPESEPSDDTQDQMDSQEDPIPEPEVEELEKAWSVLQHNRASQTRSQDESEPSDELPQQPIKVKELLSTWDWLKAKQQANQRQRQPRISSLPPPSPSTPSSSPTQLQPKITSDETVPSPSPSLDRPSDVDKATFPDSRHASSHGSANGTLPMGSSESPLPPLPDQDKGPSIPTTPAEQPPVSRISDTAPPRTGDLVAFYSWLEQNRLYRTVPNSYGYAATPSRRDAAAEIKQAKLNAMMENNNADDTFKNLPLQSSATQPQLSTSSNDLASSPSLTLDETKASSTTAGSINLGDQSNVQPIESTSSVPQQQQPPHIPVEQHEDIDQSLTTEPSRGVSTPQDLLPTQTINTIMLQEDTTTEVILEREANKDGHASPTSTVDMEQNQMKATIAAISKQLESLASSSMGPGMDAEWNSSELLMLQKIKENIQTGKVNFDEIFELWTWLEMNDFDMTKFKKRAVELGIVDSSVSSVNTHARTRLDRFPPSQEESRIHANIQQIEHKVQQHAVVRPQTTATLPVSSRNYSTDGHDDQDPSKSDNHLKERGTLVSPSFSHETNRDSMPTSRGKADVPLRTKATTDTVEYLNEDLSAIYRPQTNKAKKLAQNWWSNVYVQADQEKQSSRNDDKEQESMADPHMRGIRGDESHSAAITFLDEDLSNVYRNRSGARDTSTRLSSPIIYLDEDLSNVYRNRSGARTSTRLSSPITYLDEDLSNVYRNRSGARDTSTRSSGPITYLDEDLSNVYRTRSGARDSSTRSSCPITFLDEDLSNVYSNRSGTRDTSSRLSSPITYLDEDLSNVYRTRSGARDSSTISDSDAGVQRAAETKTATNPKLLGIHSSPRSLKGDGAKIEGDKRASTPIIYLDEDLSSVYKSHGGAPDNSTNSESMDILAGVQRGADNKTEISQGMLGNQPSQGLLDDVGPKNEEKQAVGSPIIYLDEDLSNVYQQGRTEKSRSSRTNEQTHRSQLEKTDASQSNIDYIDEDLSRFYTSNTNQGSIARPSLQAMVSYWEFSKLNNARDDEIQVANDDTKPDALADHQAQTNNSPSWQTNPYSNKMLNTLKWLETQGVDLDEVKVHDESSNSLAESTEDLELSASQLESNAAKAATLKEHDLTKTMDWLMKHGHTSPKSTTNSSTSALQAVSPHTDTSTLSLSRKVDVIDGSPPAGEANKLQTKSDLTVALSWLKRHSYKGSGQRSSMTESNEPMETQLSPEAATTRNKLIEDATEKKSREPLYDKNVLYSLSWLQKQGFDLDKSIHAERKPGYVPSEKQKFDTPRAAERKPAPTIESLMEALSSINDDEQGITPTERKSSLGKAKTPSKTSPEDIENALKWLAARGIGKSKKKRSKKTSDASSNDVKPTRKTASRELQSDLASAATEKTHRSGGDKKGDEINASSNEMSNALKWLNRKGIQTTTIKPAKSSVPKSPVNSATTKRNPKTLTNMDTKKILDIMKTQGTFSQNHRLSQDDVEQTLRFLKLQESKNKIPLQKIEYPASKAPIGAEERQSALMNTKRLEKGFVSVSKEESRANETAKNEPASAVFNDKKNALKKVPQSPRTEKSRLRSQIDSASPRSNKDSLSKTRGESVEKARDKQQIEKKSSSRSTKTRSESPGPRKNSSKTRNAKELRSKSGDFIGDMASSPKKSKQSTASTSDMQKTLKWLQTKAYMASPIKTSTATAQSQLSSKDWKNKIPSLAPLDADDPSSSRALLPPLPVKKKKEREPMEARAVQDYHNALKFLNSTDAKGLEDASYFKKLDNTLPKRPGESKEARAKEMARALAWVKKQGLFDATSKSSRKPESLAKTASRQGSSVPAASVKDLRSSFEKPTSSVEDTMPSSEIKAPTDRAGQASMNQKESKVQTERKKLSSIKDMTKEAMQRRRESYERMVATSSAQGRRSSASEPSDFAVQDFDNALKFVLTRQAGGDVTEITDAIHFKKLDNMLPLKADQSSKDRAREMVKMLAWLRKKGIA